MRLNTVHTRWTAAVIAGTCLGLDHAAAEGQDPDPIMVPAIVRDFRGLDPNREPRDHMDFENWDLRCCIISTGLVQDQLDANRKPVFKSSYGMAIAEDWTTADGRPINPAHYDPDLGDREGEWHGNNGQKRIHSAESFSTWYRDVPGTNQSMVRMLRLEPDPVTGHWVFDSDVDDEYEQLGGFFPIDGLLLGNYEESGHNFHFTTEVTASFVYDEDAEQVFTFTGDDDVWVFVDGQLALDLGGRHSQREQNLFLDRLDLVDGRSYELKIFHAERKTSGSNFRFEVTFELEPPQTANIASIFD